MNKHNITLIEAPYEEVEQIHCTLEDIQLFLEENNLPPAPVALVGTLRTKQEAVYKAWNAEALASLEAITNKDLLKCGAQQLIKAYEDNLYVALEEHTIPIDKWVKLK